MTLTDPIARPFRRLTFDPIRLGILVATLIAFAALVLLIALFGSARKRRPGRASPMLALRARTPEMFPLAPVEESFRDVA